MRSQQEEAVDKYVDAKFAPTVRDKDVKRDASVLSSGCGDLTRWNERDVLGKRDRTENSNAQVNDKGISTY